MSTTEERRLLRQTVAALVDKHASPEAVRRAIDSPRGYDEQLWAMLCEQVGVAALVVPEDFGGAGGELGDAATVLEELGRNLVPSPLLGTTLAELALLGLDAPDIETLEGLAAGDLIGTVVFDRDYVLNGDVAEVVLALEEGGIVRWTDPVADPERTLDPTRRLTRLRPAGSKEICRDPGIAEFAAILLAAEQIGAATRCLELTVEYTKQRVQFGRVIGSFQALKHRMADLYVTVQSARTVVGDAVAAPGPVSASLAGLAAGEAFRTVAAESIQLHGGIAITWEHDMHLYFKRAHGSALLFGSPREHLRRLEAEVF